MDASPATVIHLKQEGWDIIRVSDKIDPASSDEQIMVYARRHVYTIITFDLDFSKIPALGGHKTPSIINMRLQTTQPTYVANRLIEVISPIEDGLVKGAVISVDEFSIRSKRLSISETL